MAKTAVAADRLPMKTKLAFGLGGAAEMVALYSVSSFAMLFYNQVLGVPPHLVGLAISASLILDAISDPIVGSISDRTKSKLGRRHPYLFASGIPVGLTVWAIFSPPAGLGETGLLIWLGAAVILMRQAMTFFYVPHLALGGELSPHYTERSKVMSYYSFFNWAGGALTTIVALRVFFPSTPEFPRGLLNPEPWGAYAATIGLVSMAALFLSAWFTRDRIPYLPQPRADQPKLSLRGFISDIGKALANINYVWLLVAYFFVALMIGMREGMRLYVNTYYWDLSSEQLSWFVAGSLVGYLTAFLFAAKLHGKFDKKRTIILAALTYAIVPPIPLVLGMMGVLDPTTPGLVPLLIAFAAVQYGSISVLQISVMSALADVADENELKFGLRQEGILYSTRTMAGKIDMAVGTMVAGAVITLINFPEGAKSIADVPAKVLFDLALWDSIMAAIPGVIAVFFYSLYKIDRNSYEQTRAALLARRAKTKADDAAAARKDSGSIPDAAPAPAE
ncbi:MFS transporter [Phenylobacterium sp.]|uniref:MFS transporter n=1 Tax=Phenylobacterium sp. TaxID=1871053 RepID=UPI002810EE35|nr:MFS transporter [Phenylobacterium sp.]